MFFALQDVFSQCFFTLLGRFFVVYFVLQGVFSQRFFAIGRVNIACFRCKSFFYNVFSTAGCFLLCILCYVAFSVVYFVLCRVSALCILCCVAFLRHVSIHFLSHSLHFLEPRPTLLVPMHTFPKPQYVSVCRMYVTAFVNMLLLYV